MTSVFVLAGVAMFALASWNKVWAVSVALFLLPTYQVRFSLLGVPTTLLEMLVIAVIAAWVLQRMRSGGKPLATLPWRWSMLCILLAATIAVYVAPDHESALGYWRAYFVEPMLFAVVLWDVVRRERDVRLILTALGASVVILGFVALEQFTGFIPSPEPWISESPRRVASLFAYPNALGLYVAPIVGIFAAILFFPLAGMRGRRSLFPWGVVILGTLASVLAVSRGAVIAILLCVTALGLLSVHRRRVAWVAGLVVLLAVALPSTRSVMVDVIRGTDVSTDVRTVLWQGTAKLLADRPVVGAGLGGFPDLYNSYRLIKHTELLQNPHNIILNFWVEIGLAGTLCILWVFLSAVRRGARLVLHAATPWQRQMALGILAAMFITVVHGIVDVPYFKNDLALLFWSMLFMLPILASARDTGQIE